MDIKGSSNNDQNIERKFPAGTFSVPGGGVNFRVWAPGRHLVELVIEGGTWTGNDSFPISYKMNADVDGYFSLLVTEADIGTLYRYRIDGSEETYPDPVSRFQPDGPFGPSQVIDPDEHQWQDDGWKGIIMEGQILYEMHIGTFTKEGTWHAAAAQLPELTSLGITAIELLPVADFPGNFGWGYDGVNMFAPSRLYGSPDDFRAFVDKAHNYGIAVLLDVVYNHFGPAGNYLNVFSDYYQNLKKATEWGASINFDNENSRPVRDFYITNARIWIEEYHLDGLRFDAAQSMFDKSDKHILTEIIESIKKSAGSRQVITIAEDEQQHAYMIRAISSGGLGLDGMWNEDYHHSAIVAITGRKEAYYSDHRGSPQEFLSLAKHGFLFQGQLYKWQRFPRGTPALDIEPYKFVNYIQNHDQVANTPYAWRCHKFSGPAAYRALSAYFLLSPGTPMIFQGQEFAADTPFHYFVDHDKDLIKIVWQGRKKFLSQFRDLATKEYQDQIPDPSDPVVFESSKLDFGDRMKNREIYELYKDLIRLRKEDPAFRKQAKGSFDGSVIGEDAFIIRHFLNEGDRLLMVNFGRELILHPAPEPLLAPPENMEWTILWSSEDVKYGGNGLPPVISKTRNIMLPASTVVVMYAVNIQE